MSRSIATGRTLRTSGASRSTVLGPTEFSIGFDGSPTGFFIGWAIAEPPAYNYDFQYRIDGGDWVTPPGSVGPSFGDFSFVYPPSGSATEAFAIEGRLRANYVGQQTEWVNSNVLQTPPGPYDLVAVLNVTDLELSWSQDGGDSDVDYDLEVELNDGGFQTLDPVPLDQRSAVIDLTGFGYVNGDTVRARLRGGAAAGYRYEWVVSNDVS